MGDPAHPPANWYCDVALNHPVHKAYHDHAYGAPIRDDSALLERLAMEIFQAGLSWELILKRQESLNRAFEGFRPETVAAYGAAEVERLLADPGIIRNRRKVLAIIENSKRILNLRPRYGSFAGWLDAHHPRDKAAWVRLFKKTFVFTGQEIVGEFLMGIGYLEGAHRPDCPAWAVVAALSPPWMQKKGAGP